MEYQVNESEIIGDVIDGEVILLNLQAGTYYGLDGTAATLWHYLQQGVPQAQVAEALSAAYPLLGPESLQADLGAWLQELVEQGLIHPAQGVPTSGISGETPVFPGEYQKPTLVAHMDMQELLQLDPVHGAGDQGWPTVPTL